MKKVLIALDYNPTAQKVAELGFAMATAMKAEIVLLHVITDPVYYSSPEYSPIMGYKGSMEMGSLQRDSITGLKEASRQFLETTRQYLGDESIRTIVKEGDFADSILSTANEIHAEIIVMGSHSRKWLKEIVMGSVTEKVLHHTRIPLLIIPTNRKGTK